jgi:DNA-binding beta-propeller fold protein YncE
VQQATGPPGRLTGGIAALAAAALAAAFVPAASAQTLGQLTPLNCFSTSAVTGCTTQPGLNGAGGQSDNVAVSPDGQSVYAVMSLSTVVQFAVQPDGSLAYVTCIGDATLGGSNPCPIAATGIKQGNGGTGGVVVSPDGAHVYVSGFDSNTVAVFRRDTGGATLGHLTSEGCLANSGVTTCDAVPGTTHGQAPGLGGPLRLALSPDGANLYVPGISSKTVAVLKREVGGPAAGKLTSDGCLAYSSVATCDAVSGSTHARAPALEVPDAVAVSPDGRTVYVTDALAAIAVLGRDVGGATPGRLVSDGCLADSTFGGTKCDAVAGSTLGRVPGIGNPQLPIVSPDGLHVYVGGQSTVAVFRRDGGGPTPGHLTSEGCLAKTPSGACDGVAGPTHGSSLGASGSGLAISPDGASLYTADLSGSLIGVFRVDAAGALAFDGCLADTGTPTCDAVPGATHGQAPGILRPRSVSVAPNGSAVYAVSDSPGSAVAFARFVPAPAPPPPSPPAFAGASLAKRTIRINPRGRGVLAIACPALAQGPCSGRAVIKSASKIALPAAKRKRIRRLARVSFSGVQAGATKDVRFRVSKRVRRLVFRKRKLKAVTALTAHDSRNTSVTTRTRVTLRPKRRR